jgi:hypothetical protein
MPSEGLGLSLDHLVSLAGRDILIPLSDPLPRVPRISGAVIHERGATLPAAEDLLLLAVGFDVQSQESVDLVHAAADAHLAGVVMRPRGGDPARLTAVARRRALPLLGAVQDRDWGQLQSLIEVLVGANDDPLATKDALGPVDLFAIADSLVALVGGIVIIEDADRLPIAHSTGHELMDRPALAEAVVRRHPNPLSDDAGVHALIMRSHQPTYLRADNAGDGDLAMPIRAGTEILGCVWAVGVEDSGESRSLVLEAARRCREHLSRTRLEGDWARRRREDRLRLLLQGGAGDLQLSSDLGLGVAPTARVLAFGPAPDQQASWSLLGRAALLAQNAADAHRVPMATAPSLELACSYGLVSGDQDPPTIARFGASLVAELERRLGGVWRLAIGNPVASVRDLPASTQQAEQILAALHGDFGGRSVAVASDVATAIYLERVQSLLRADGDLPHGPVDAIRLYDAEESTDYVSTLTAWIHARSDTGDAAAALFIHPNTLRYRLKRIEELFALDLSDPDVRLAITIQLRLRRPSPHGR